MPLLFEPIFKRKPWGGRRLEKLLQKRLPAGEAIGESWELVSLPGNESVVRSGPLAGRTLHELVRRWGTDLLGDAALVDGRFPLLVKFLDACQNLSVQVHPKPVPGATAWQPGVKHEAWYILHADPDAALFVGTRTGVTLEHLRAVAGTPATRNLLRSWRVSAGDCLYLPSGIVHALGAGIVVAEVQDPSDVTYRLYDWDRVDADGRPRDLHVEQAIANVRLDIPDQLIIQPRTQLHSSLATGCRLVTCERFTVDTLSFVPDRKLPLPAGKMRVWIATGGYGSLLGRGFGLDFRAGDVVLIPAGAEGWHVSAAAGTSLLEITLTQPARQRE